MSIAARIAAGAVLALAFGSLLLGCAAALGVIPVAPPQLLVPTLSIAAAVFGVVKVAAIAWALIAHTAGSADQA